MAFHQIAPAKGRYPGQSQTRGKGRLLRAYQNPETPQKRNIFLLWLIIYLCEVLKTIKKNNFLP
jgi:hypothetical protein